MPEQKKGITSGVRIEINNRTKSKIDVKLVKRVVAGFARVHRVGQKEISIAFVGDFEIKKINQTYRRVNKPTDILTFAGEADFWGELIMDYSQIKRQAGQFGKSVREEFIFILVHGLLHLLGHDDEQEKGRLKMIKLGEEFIKKLKIK